MSLNGARNDMNDFLSKVKLLAEAKGIEDLVFCCQKPHDGSDAEPPFVHGVAGTADSVTNIRLTAYLMGVMRERHLNVRCKEAHQEAHAHESMGDIQSGTPECGEPVVLDQEGGA